MFRAFVLIQYDYSKNINFLLHSNFRTLHADGMGGHPFLWGREGSLEGGQSHCGRKLLAPRKPVGTVRD